MPVVSDFIRILGDKRRVVGGGNPVLKRIHFNFDTGGRHAAASAYIMFMVKGMTQTSQNAEVFLNGERIGFIFNNNGGRRNEWQTQVIHFDGGALRVGSGNLNKLTFCGAEIVASDRGCGHAASDNLDSYTVSNVICHFHQDV